MKQDLSKYTKEDILAYLKELGVTVYTQEEVDELIIIAKQKTAQESIRNIEIQMAKEQYEQNN